MGKFSQSAAHLRSVFEADSFARLYNVKCQKKTKKKKKKKKKKNQATRIYLTPRW